MKEIDRRLRVIDQVIRHLVVRVDEELRVARADARRAQGEPGARAAWRAGCRRSRQPGERRGDGDSQDDDRDGHGGPAMREERGGGGRGGGRGGDKKDDKGGDAPRRGFFRRRRVCKFCAEKIDYINYKDVRLLAPFLPERGKIQPRRISGHVRAASAQAADRDQARAAAGADAVRDRLVDCT